jgi:hypothetical protein
MTKFLKKIKTELFFIYKLLNPKYTPSCAGDFKAYLNYFKNRFFIGSLIHSVPKFSFKAEDDFEVHILVQKSDIWPLIWTLTSFLFHSGLRPKLVIHDDGSLDDKSCAILNSKFDNLEVIRRAFADKTINSELGGKYLEFRKRGHPLIFKLIDIVLLSRSAKVMVLDSDILFFNRPEDIINFVKGSAPCEALISGIPDTYAKFNISAKGDYLAKYRLPAKGVEYMNSGIILYDRAKVTKKMLFEYLDNCTLPKEHYFVEMTGWNCLIGRLNFKFLPVDKYIIKGRISENTVAKHFTSGRRQEMYAYGIDKVRKEIGY